MSLTEFAVSSPTVLVADDSPEIRQYLRLLLELEGYSVDLASNGAEAIELLRNGSRAKLAVLDVQMPGINGIETLRHLRELRPDLKAIICSGVGDSDTIKQAMDAGAEEYLIKPVRRLYLSAALDRCLLERREQLSLHDSGARLLNFEVPRSRALPS